MFSKFFIDRPVFASVVSIVIVVLGAVALVALPVARYPDLAPPTIQVSCTYAGADARTVSDTVAATIEKEVNGVEGMIYMSSVCANDGSMNLTVTFESGTDLDIANVLVQNRVAVAQSRLPEEVKRTGVTVKKRSTDTVLYAGLISPDGTYDDAFLSNYANLNIRDEIYRVPGVGDVTVYGTGEFSMRIWLNPDQLRARKLAASDVISAVREQNIQVAAGKIGAAPSPEGTASEYVLSTTGRLSEVSEFENIVVATTEGGRTVRLRDVARVELGSNVYNFSSRLTGADSATIAIFQIPGSNVIEVADGVKETLARLKKDFPAGVDYHIVYDSTDVINASIKEVITTLIATLILVVLTVYIFLQNARATLIPAVAIPVSLIGTFFVLLLLGFSLNQLTLFGLVLVIGIVVDDAIIVVENTFVHLEKGLTGREAATAAMKEVSGPVVATTLVLLSVFVPMTMMEGITGTMFKQFAVTISVATVFSSICALTLSPALCGILLKKPPGEAKGLYKAFNSTLAGANKGYVAIVRRTLKLVALAVILFIGGTVLAVMGLGGLPTGFVPQEDEGYCMINIQLPDGASVQRTDEVTRHAEELLSQIDGVKDYLVVNGYSIVDSAVAPNTAFILVTFDPWDDRKTPALHQDALIPKINQSLASIQEASAFAFPMPSLPGVGMSGGFTFMLQDRQGAGLEQLQAVAGQLSQEATAQSGIAGARSTFRSSVPQLFIDIDREAVKRTGTSMTSVFDTLQIYLGSAYINDFTLFGRVYRVTAQADGVFRSVPNDVNKLQLRGSNGQMIPLGAVAEVREILGPQTITRFNMYPAARIMGNPAPGFSSGQAMAIMEDMADKNLPPSMGYSWSELSFQEKQAAGGMGAIFLFSILMVYLVLAAQYESWTLPISVCLAVPVALLGLIAAIIARGMDNNVYTQIGIVLLIGLSAKTAILLTEFAAVKRAEGMSIFDAACEAVKLRFRAVLMTALSFVLGVIPLVIASGAGAESRQILGTAVLGGMLAATILGMAIVPMLYYVVQSITEKLTSKGK
ncbi:efflux RND transporter permease subunit [Sulfuriroseicoccus oceanibius]|uniref:Multidrug efflux RND transporter permease subunit n=1 Tax=Sulfuriroseicoccus oceanibius TaxID=2707525 RepID=A0A6B3LCA7_9BACT|nr:multidrug efflux RND transporter permease subunit [Sulfuriroseicoccus oceanibius]QQL45333.1 multidrug efflux RND transporter permease subunit [Sulfuriroseicoccus oceanibius]